MAKNTQVEGLFSGVKPVRKPQTKEQESSSTKNEAKASAEIPTDQALKPLDFEKKKPRKTVHKTFLFTEEVAEKLVSDAKKYDISQGEYLAALIKRGV